MSEELTFDQVPALVAKTAVAVRYEKQAAGGWDDFTNNVRKVLATPEAMGALGGAGIGGLLGGASALDSPKRKKPFLSSIGTGMLAGGAAGLGGGMLYRQMKNAPGPKGEAPPAARGEPSAGGGADPDTTGYEEMPTEELVQQHGQLSETTPGDVAARMGRAATSKPMVGLLAADAAATTAGAGLRAWNHDKGLIPADPTAFMRGANNIPEGSNLAAIPHLREALTRLSPRDIDNAIAAASRGYDYQIPISANNAAGTTTMSLSPMQIKNLMEAGGGRTSIPQNIAAMFSEDRLAGTGLGGSHNPTRQMDALLDGNMANQGTASGIRQALLRLWNRTGPRTTRARAMTRAGVYGPLLALMYGSDDSMTPEARAQLEAMGAELQRRWAGK